MFELPRPSFAQSPLLILAVAISSGILLGHQISFLSRSVFVFSTSVVIGLTFITISLVRKRKLKLAPMLLAGAFIFAGLALSVIEKRDVAHDRISRVYQTGIIAAGDPVELTGTIEGQPEHAPQSFYLTIHAERIRSKGIEFDASGAVLLFAQVREQHVRQEYDALELRHGARVRVMTALDRAE